MPVFPNYKPSFATAGDRQFKIKSSAFGDGFEQRMRSGLNNIPLMFNVSFNKRRPEELSHIDAFLTSLAGVDPFEWTPPIPHDYSNAAPFIFGNGYIGGAKVKSGNDVLVSLKTHSNQLLTNATYWVWVCRLPLKFICKKGNWVYNAYNSNSITAVFEQVFDA